MLLSPTIFLGPVIDCLTGHNSNLHGTIQTAFVLLRAANK